MRHPPANHERGGVLSVAAEGGQLLTTDDDRLARAYARLQGLKENLPNSPSLPERYVREYHEALDHLSSIGRDIDEFKVRPEDVVPRLAGMSRSGQPRYTQEKSVDRAILLSKLQAVITYFELSVSDAAPEPRRSIGFRPPERA